MANNEQKLGRAAGQAGGGQGKREGRRLDRAQHDRLQNDRAQDDRAGFEDVTPRAADRRWVRQAVAACVAIARKRGVRYARRLSEQYDPSDAMVDLLTLGARRVAPLPERRERALPRTELSQVGRAFLSLDRADRAILSRLGNGSAVAENGSLRHEAPLEWRPGEREHAAAALERLTVALEAQPELRPGSHPASWPSAGQEAVGDVEHAGRDARDDGDDGRDGHDGDAGHNRDGRVPP